MNIISKIKAVWPISYQTDELTGKHGERAVTEIPIHSVKPSPYQPRRIFESDALGELAESIKKYGVIQPITVRKLDADTYELVAGERRLRACSLCGMLKVPAIVINLDDNSSALVALVENIQRENLSFLEEAEAYRNLLYHHGFTQEELASKLGKTQATVANKIRLLKLASVVREIIKDHKLTERHARALLRLETEKDQLDALEKITSRHLNVHQTEELIEQMISGTNHEEAFFQVKEERRPPKLISKKSLKDVRIFLNTVRRAINLMQENGINAEVTEEEFGMYYEYVIKIPKGEKVSTEKP